MLPINRAMRKIFLLAVIAVLPTFIVIRYLGLTNGLQPGEAAIAVYLFPALQPSVSGQWVDFSIDRSNPFYAYSAFVDDRNSSQPVVRIIAITTKPEELRHQYIGLFCHFWYNDGRRIVVSLMLDRTQTIGVGYPMGSAYAQENIYACPLQTASTESKDWPSAVTILSTAEMHSNASTNLTLRVEVPVKSKVVQPLAICVQVAYKSLDATLLVDWFELQRILGVSKVGVYLASDINRDAAAVFRHYAEHDGLVELRKSNYIRSRAGSDANEYVLHWSPTINDCIYRNMYRYRRIAVIDFDEVIVPRLNWTRLTDFLNYMDRQHSSPAQYTFRNNYFFTDLPPSDNTSTSTFIKYRLKVALSPPGYSVKSIIDPKSCIGMHNHYCWGFVPGASSKVDVNTELGGLLQHYKRCHLGETECRQLMANVSRDDTMLKYRTLLEALVNKRIQVMATMKPTTN